MGEPVCLVSEGKREAVTSGRGVEVSLDHEDREDSDDLAYPRKRSTEV